MKNFLLTFCVVLVSARPEGGYHYNPPTSSPSGGNYLSCCHRLALLQRNHGSQGNHGAAYSESAAAGSLNTQTAARIVNGHSSNGYSSGYTSNGLSSGQTSNGYTQASNGINTGHITSGATSSLTGGGYSSDYSSSGLTGGHTANSLSGSQSSGVSSGLTGAHSSSGLVSGHTSSSLQNSHLSAGHTSSGLSANSIPSTFADSQSSSLAGSASSFAGHTSANSIRGSSGSSQGFVGGSGAGASFTPNNFNRGSLSSDGGELDGSASSGSFNSAGLGGGFSSKSNTGLVQKHIYVHVPPHDDEEAIMRAKYASLMQPKKHYKIIFIKAPTAPSFPTAQLIANAGQQEEKTLVYVLVKKPEEPSVADIKAAQASIQTNKPEVYFIKYKTREQQSNFGNVVGDGSFSGTDLSGYSVANNQAFSYNSGSALADTVSITTEIPTGSYGVPPPSTVYGTK